MTNMSTTKHLDATIRQRDLAAARADGTRVGRQRGCALVPDAYCRDDARRDAWVDGYFDGLKMPKEGA